jgi:hypothetical protein
LRKRLAAIAALTCVLVCIPASSALGHASGNPHYRSVIDRVTPNVPGVHFEVLDYDAYIELRVEEGHEVVIYGYEGEPYARVLKNGTVQVNERSPAYYLNETRYPVEQSVPPSANAKAPPKWKTIGSSGLFTWHDHRMHYASPSVPPQVTDQSKRTKVYDYEIPLRIDGKKGAIHGTLYWAGVPNVSKAPFIIGGIVFVVVAGGLVLFIRRRQRMNEADGGEPGGEPGGDGNEPEKEAW